MTEKRGFYFEGSENPETYDPTLWRSLVRSAGSGNPDDMADYLEEHDDTALADYAAEVGIDMAHGCLDWLLSTNTIFALSYLRNAINLKRRSGEIRVNSPPSIKSK